MQSTADIGSAGGEVSGKMDIRADDLSSSATQELLRDRKSVV
jgi:hypothetical protein